MAVSKILSSDIVTHELVDGIDLNDITVPAFYYHHGNTNAVHAPSDNSDFTLMVLRKNGGQPIQIVIDNSNRMFFRIKWVAAWQAWRQITTTTVS